MVGKFSWIFGIVTGFLATAMFAAGNLFATPIFEHMREDHRYLFGLPWPAMLIQTGMVLLALAGFVTAYRTRSFIAAVKVGALSGLIGGSMLFVTSMGMTVAYHDAMMQDPGNVHEYQLSVREPPTREELSSFLYWDALGGALNMMWMTPLAGAILGAMGGGLFVLASHPPSRTAWPAT